MTSGWDGLLAIDKPAGPTSHDVVAHIRAVSGCARVGHTGTLDPPATGLLVLLLGRATRLARFVPSEPKSYEGEIVFGITTTTDDASGEIVRRHDGPPPAPEAVRAAGRARLGSQLQVPPAFSARHVEGTRLYRMARRGLAVEARATPVRVDAFELAPTADPLRWRYGVRVSAGTYVRALARDLGAALGCGAVVASLRRTAIGTLGVDDALRLPPEDAGLCALLQSRIVPIDAIPLGMASLVVSELDADRFAAGTPFEHPDAPTSLAGEVAVRDGNGTLLGVGLLDGPVLRPRVVLVQRAALPGPQAV